MMEISNILPVIASANQQAAERSRTRFLWGFIGVSIALVIILILSFVNNRQPGDSYPAALLHPDHLQLQIWNAGKGD